MDIYQDCKDGAISKETRNKFFTLIEDYRLIGVDKYAKDMQDILTNIYEKTRSQTSTHKNQQVTCDFFKKFNYEVIEEYIDKVSSIDPARNNEPVYLAEYADMHDKNLAHWAFMLFEMDSDRTLYTNLSKKISDYLVNCCSYELEEFETKHQLYLYSKLAKDKNTTSTPSEQTTPTPSRSKIYKSMMENRKNENNKETNTKSFHLPENYTSQMEMGDDE